MPILDRGTMRGLLVVLVSALILVASLPLASGQPQPIYNVPLAPMHDRTVSGNVSVAYNVADASGDSSDISVTISVAVGDSSNWTIVATDPSNSGTVPFDSRPFTNRTLTIHISAIRQRDGTTLRSNATITQVHIAPFDPRAPVLVLQRQTMLRHVLVEVTVSDPRAVTTVTLFRNFCTDGAEGYVCMVPQAPVPMQQRDQSTYTLDIRLPDYTVSLYLQAHGATNGSVEVLSPFIVMHLQPISPEYSGSLHPLLLILGAIIGIPVVLVVILRHLARNRLRR